jgi:DNA-binding CsgD family transcriptional regulator
MVTPRKHTWDLNRANADETLRLYETGIAPKQLAEQAGIAIEQVWQRIKLARKRRAKAQGETA